MVVESVSEEGAAISSMFWDGPQYISFIELTFL